MKTLLLTLFLSFTVLHSYAQIESDKLLYLEKAEKYRRMKTTGKVLTLGGSAMAVIGLVTLISSTTTTTNNGSGPTQTSSTGNPEAGAMTYLLGNVAAGVGVPLWIVGGINEGRYNRKAGAISVRLQASPQDMGMKLLYRF